jgi:DNA-binding NarL/FixJ family response regulator
VTDQVLIGRTSEIARLHQFVDHAGRGVLYLSGEPGIGKSALISELRNQADRRVTLLARCNELGSAPYGPLLDAIDHCLAVRGPDGAEPATELSELSALLRSRSVGDDLTIRLSDAGHHLARAARLLNTLGATERSLVIVEDAQWADPMTRQLLDHLSADAEQLTFPIIVTSRVPPRLADSPLSSGRRQRLDLRPLTVVEVSALAAQILRGEVSEPLAADLHTRTGGNPFVVDALLLHAINDGLVTRTADGWVTDGWPVEDCPPELAAWLIGQHRDIDPDTWQLLELAALIGERVDPELLRLAGEIEPSDPLLESVEATGLLAADSDGQHFVFRHALVRAAIDTQIGVVRRRALHDRIAVALEVRSPDGLVERIRHLVAAGRSEEAIPLRLEAAGAALQARSYAEARDLLIDLVDVLDDASKGVAFCRLALAQRQLGESRDAVESATRGVALLEAAGRIQEAAAERLMLGFFAFESEGPTRSGTEYRQARDQLEAFGESEPLALAYVWSGASSVVNGDVDKARADIERGLEMADRTGSPTVRAWAHQFLGMLETKLGNTARGLDLIDLSYREGVELGADLLAERALENACLPRVVALRAREVEPLLAGHLHASDTGNWPLFRDCGLLGSLIELGEIERALALASELRAGLRHAGAGGILEWVDDAYAGLLADSGRPRQALEVMRGSLERLATQDVAARSHAHIRFLLVTGDTDNAARVATEALDASDRATLDHRLASRAAEAFIAARQTEALSHLRAMVEADRGLGKTAWADLVTGTSLLAAGEQAAARTPLVRAASRFATASYRILYARCLALQAIAAGVDHADSGLLVDALAILEAAGAHGIATEITALAASYARPTEAPSTPLTPRELDVLRLLATGMTDAQVAAHLAISRRTVASHLDRIRDKTGRRRRAELTRLAIDLNLLEGSK